MIRRFSALIWILLVTTVISLAVVLSVARVLLPYMSDYKSELETVVSRQISHKVEIGNLDAGWRGVSPVLALKDVRLTSQSAEKIPLTIREVHVALDIWQSLLSRKWLTRSIELVGMQLMLYRTIDGHWSMTGTAQDQDNVSLDLLLRQYRVGLQDAQVTWVDQMQGGLTRIFHGVDALLINEGNNHRFSVQTELPASLGKSLQVIGQLSGSGNVPAQWSGRIYCKADELQLRHWLHWFPDFPVKVQGQLSSELWGNWSGQELTGIAGQINGRALNLAMKEADRQPYKLERLNGRFSWQKTLEGWRLDADEVAMYRNDDADWSDIALGAQWDKPGGQYRLTVNQVPIVEMSLAASRFAFVDDKVRAWISRLEPKGFLHDVEFEARLADDFNTPQISMRTRFTELSVDASDGMPGISGLAGSIEGNLQQGILRLDSDGLAVLAPEVFRNPLVFTKAAADINWRRYSDRMQVDTSQLQLTTFDGVDLSARGQLDWIYGESAPILDLQTVFNDLDLKQVSYYLPTGVMSPKLVDWLDEALKSGAAKSPRVLIQGRLDQMPFDLGDGVFLADFGIDQAVLDYSPEWGRLDELQGYAQFSGRSMHIEGKQAKLQRADVSNVIARIDDLVSPVLTIKGSADDSLPGMLNYVQTTPLKKRFSPLIKAVSTNGRAGLDIDLNIPLKKQLGEMRVKGDVNFRTCGIADRKGRFKLSDIKGRLHFTEDVLSARKVRAQLYGAPVDLELYPLDEGGGKTVTVLDINGPLQLVDWMKSSGWKFASYLDGIAQWQTRLYFKRDQDAGQTDISLRLDSDLQGITSSLPAPFNKTAGTAIPVKIEWQLDSDTGQPVHIKYGDKANAILARNKAGEITAGEVVFGGGNPQLPDKKELHLSGRVPVIKPLEWAELFAGKNKGVAFPPLAFDLLADRISLFDHSVNGVGVKSSSSTPWDFTLTGDPAAGSLQLMFGNDGKLQAIKARLERLHLMLPPEHTKRRNNQEKVSPKVIPDLSVNIDNFRWGEPALGSLVLETAAVNDGIDIKQLQLKSRALTVTGHGQWQDTGTVQSTRVDMKILDGSLEKLLRLFSNSNAVDNGDLSGEVTAAWPGSPADLTLNNLEGELKLKIGEGRLKDVDTGAGRLLGLLSMQSIPRRLFLDFSDLFKKGYSFDKLEGTFLLNDGSAFTRDLKIYGPAADIEIVGRTGLVEQDYDELVSVIPHLSSTLPIAGAIAGGPGVGAAVLLAERLLGSQVNQLSKVQYQVTGSWDDPQYTRFEKPKRSIDESAYGDDE